MPSPSHLALQNINVGTYLDRNDIRVAEAWMDEYKAVFYDFRHLHGKPFGDISERLAVRKQNDCHSFKWFLDNVAYDIYVPGLQASPGRWASLDGKTCLANPSTDFDGPAKLQSCALHNDRQQWVFGEDGYIYLNVYPKHAMLCLRIETVALVGCETAEAWVLDGNRYKLSDDPTQCLERGLDQKLRVRKCSPTSLAQEWQFEHGLSNGQNFPGTVLKGADTGHCLDNMQRQRGAPGLYGCHSGATQRWKLSPGRVVLEWMFACRLQRVIRLLSVLGLLLCDFIGVWLSSDCC